MVLRTTTARSKAEYRRLIVDSRRRLSRKDRLEKSRRIWEICRRLPGFRHADLLCSYVAFGEEVETSGLLRELLRSRRRIAVPVQGDAGGNPAFAEISDWNELVPNSLGFLEPAPDRVRLIPTASIGCFLVPGVAFDTLGNRLGYGLGYYDRALQSATRESVLIGLAFDLQVVKSLPVSEHDVPMDYVVTETRVLDPSAAGDR